jgi:hypothetical protein
MSTVCMRCHGDIVLADLLLVVPSEDSHQSEYIAPCDARRGLKHCILNRVLPLLTPDSLYQWIHWLSWHRCYHTRESCLGYRWPIFQSGRKTTGCQLGPAQTRIDRRSHMARMVYTEETHCKHLDMKLTMAGRLNKQKVERQWAWTGQ